MAIALDETIYPMIQLASSTDLILDLPKQNKTSRLMKMVRQSLEHTKIQYSILVKSHIEDICVILVGVVGKVMA